LNFQIFGDNGTGKTLICDIIASIGHPEKIEKWKERYNSGSSNYSVSYYGRKISKYRVNFSSKNKISYSLDEEIIPTILSPYFCLYLEEDFFEVTRDIEGISMKLAKYFQLDESQIIELINFINKLEKSFLNEIYFEDNELMIIRNPNGRLSTFSSLSSGEKYRVILEIALRLSNYYSKHKPTVLIIEHAAIASVDYSGINTLLKAIHQKKANYQFIFTSHRNPEMFEIEDYHSYILKYNKENNVEIILNNNG
jgi:ABC-type molybdenum transport system ATPase subunit/photorepair protein PhrA